MGEIRPPAQLRKLELSKRSAWNGAPPRSIVLITDAGVQTASRTAVIAVTTESPRLRQSVDAQEAAMCLAAPGRILSTSGYGILRSGIVDFSGTRREVSLAFVPEARIADYVMVHVGFAISVVDATEAERALSDLQALQQSGDRD